MNPLFAPARGVTSINSQKNHTWFFSNPEVLEKTDATTLRKEFHELTFLTFDQRLKKAAAGEALL